MKKLQAVLLLGTAMTLASCSEPLGSPNLSLRGAGTAAVAGAAAGAREAAGF